MGTTPAATVEEADDALDAELFAIADGLACALDLLDSCSTEYKTFEQLTERLQKALT